MALHLFSYIVFSMILTATLMGCDRDEEQTISLMRIESYQIYIAPTEIPTLYTVSVKVIGILWDSCHSHHETHYYEPDISRRILSPNYVDSDTINIEITQSKYTGSEDCLTAEHYHVPVLFLGYFEHGEYTLKINNYSDTFAIE